MFIEVRTTSLKDALIRVDRIDSVRYQGRCEYGDYYRIYFTDGSTMNVLDTVEKINKRIKKVMREDI